METQALTLDRDQARELWQAYRKHQHYSEPIDHEIARAYHLLAQGRLVIKALDSLRAAGLDEKGHPKLALVRADAKRCYWTPEWRGGGGRFSMEEFTLMADGGRRMPTWTRAAADHHHRRHVVVNNWPAVVASHQRAEAIVPLIPIHLRPRRGLANYHILFEAEWQPVPPKDPYLLRRIGKGDMWLVVAMWDLTEIERAALAARITA